MEEDENLEEELDRVNVIFPPRVPFDFEGFYNWSPLEKRGDDNDFDQFEGGLDMNDILGKNGEEPENADRDGDGDGGVVVMEMVMFMERVMGVIVIVMVMKRMPI